VPLTWRRASAYRPGDIDIIWTAGYGFPDHRGGPIFMADTIACRPSSRRCDAMASCAVIAWLLARGAVARTLCARGAALERVKG